MITTTKTFFLQEELGPNGNFGKLDEELRNEIDSFCQEDRRASIFDMDYNGKDFPIIAKWLMENGVTRDEKVIFVFNQF